MATQMALNLAKELAPMLRDVFEKKQPKKAKKAKAPRQPRMRALPVGVPAARRVINTLNRIQVAGGQDRLILKGREFLVNLSGGPAPVSGRTVMRPINSKLKYLQGIAMRYSNYRWKKLTLHYQGNVGTTQDGRFIAVPVYSHDHEDIGLIPSASEFSRTVGHRKCSVWDSVSMPIDVTKFSRSDGRYSVGVGDTNAEGNAPCHALYLIEGMSSSQEAVGFLELEYEVELIGSAPGASHVFGGMVRVDSTNPASLGLHNATEFIGDIRPDATFASSEGGKLVPGVADSDTPFVLTATNTITFNVSGAFVLRSTYTGSNTPTPDYNGYVVYDAHGNNVSSRAFRADVNQDGDFGAANAITVANEAVTFLYLSIATGDRLVIPALASGSMTSVLLEILEWSGKYLPYQNTS
jgi:hypothetical protein